MAFGAKRRGRMGGPDSASPRVTLPKASLKYLEPSPPKSGAWCGVLSSAVPYRDLCVHLLVLLEFIELEPDFKMLKSMK